jgi:hypothetical protein
MAMLAKITSTFYHKFIKIVNWSTNDRYAHIIKTSWLDYMPLFSNSHFKVSKNSSNSAIHKALLTYKIVNFINNMSNH